MTDPTAEWIRTDGLFWSLPHHDWLQCRRGRANSTWHGLESAAGFWQLVMKESCVNVEVENVETALLALMASTGSLLQDRLGFSFDPGGCTHADCIIQAFIVSWFDVCWYSR